MTAVCLSHDSGYFKRQFPLQGSHASSGSELSQEDGAPRQHQQQPHSLSGGLVVCGDWLVVAGGPMADGLQVSVSMRAASRAADIQAKSRCIGMRDPRLACVIRNFVGTINQ